MTRILRLLLIAAVAWPMWQSAAAQDSPKSGPVSEVKMDDVSSNQGVDFLTEQKDNMREQFNITTQKCRLNDVSKLLPSSCSTKFNGGSEISKNVKKSVTTKADKIVVTPPEGVTIEEWNISTDWYQYSSSASDWVNYSFNPTVKVAIDGNDIYIAGLCLYLEDAWIKGTIEGDKVIFPSGQYYGTTNSIDLWFIGQNLNDEIADVVFDYNEGLCSLALNSSIYLFADAASADELAYYSYHSNVHIYKVLSFDETINNISYKWPINSSTQNTSKLSDIATDPDQIIAMIREVYTNRLIPGNYKRGFTSSGDDDSNNNVNYGGVGTITLSGNNLSYTDDYGWDIPGDLVNGTSGNYQYFYMKPEQYKPYREGVTLLLVELVDNFKPENVRTTSTASTPYLKLRDYIQKSIKSVRIVKEAKYTGSGLDAGTLFKIDCDKMNKFFLMAKGQLRWIHNSYFAQLSGSSYLKETFCDAPCFIYYNSNYNGFYDDRSFQLFYNMFEEFSPVANNASAGLNDIYQSLVNMDSFGVEHDCMGVAYQGHQFMMYGESSESADCQDVRDLMFFVPDYRMMAWSGRDNSSLPNYQKYMNYNTAHKPTMGLYVIRQDEVEEMTKADTYYKLKLTWDSNMDEFLPGEQQEYQLYQVIADDFGVLKWVPVYKRNAQGQYWNPTTQAWQADTTGAEPVVLTLNPSDSKTYTDVYEMRESSSRYVTYAIRGCDTGHFLSLQMSNEQSYLIEGLDPAEMAMLSSATIYSRFEAQDVRNCYSNKLQLKSSPQTIKASFLPNGSTMTINRTHRVMQNNQSVEITQPIATLTVTNSGSNKYFTVTGSVVENQEAVKALFPKGSSDGLVAGYHANNLTNNQVGYNTTTVGGVEYINFDISLWDNFFADVSKNEHPGLYIYQLRFNTAESFTGLNGQTTDAYSNYFPVFVYKTDSQINEPLTLEQVDGDTGCSDDYKPGDVEFGAHVMLSSKTEILRYDAYRWKDGVNRSIVIDGGATDAEEEDADPHGIAGNQGGSYSVTMNAIGTADYYVGDPVSVSTAEPWNWATFVDYYPAKNPDAYVYAPVVELFTRGYQEGSTTKVRTDYNTYGGPLQETATGKLHVKVVNPEVSENVNNPLMSTHTWEDEDGNKYAYYNIKLNVDEKTIPEDYEIYKIRAWREIPVDLQGEEYTALNGRMGARVLFEDITYPDYDKNDPYPLGSGDDSQTVEGADYMQHTYTCYKGTFGARKLRTEGPDETGVISELPYKFIVRIYFTKKGNLNQAQPGAKDGDYVAVTNPDAEFYVAEYEFEGFFDTTNVPTAIQTLDARQPVGVKYYNPAGIESDTPFKGVNIVVTRYSDGSTTTTKILK